MDEATARPADRLDALIEDLHRLFRPQGPPLSWAGSELTMGQLRLLLRLRHEGPLTMGSIARSADCSLQSATAIIERIERRHLVERRRVDSDRRVVECHLTPAGRRLIDEMAGSRAQSMRAALSVLEPDELAQLHDLILAMATRQTRAPEPQPQARA